ncbi:MAG: acyl-CoA dehydrogenase [Blastococcus sp.]|nr:acyl-CoA dehydrogenase [Blastococcus sp.]
MQTARPPGADDAAGRAGAAFRALVATGWTVPLPGAGSTAERWESLAALGATDLPLARLAEGHADAVAVLAELGGPRIAADHRLGVWAAEPPAARLVARQVDGGWLLDGRKAWCSGARTLTHALVTAHADDGPRLFLAGLTHGGVTSDPTVWTGLGMVASDTSDVFFDAVPAAAVGGPCAYVERPGFWHGGIGVAAVWTGGARAVATRLHATAAGRGADPLLAAAVGAVDVALHAATAALRDAAREVDRDAVDLAAARLRALRVRAVVARSVDDVLAVAGRSLGAGPLAHDREHAQRVADLSVYVRQHHGERDLAALGRLLCEEGA